MLIAHLPAGYLVTKGIHNFSGNSQYMWLGLVASILPDVDIVYFYFIDERQINHREYITHLPLFWAILACLSLAYVYVFLRSKRAYIIIVIFFSNIAIHMVLDSYSGYIKWLYPLFYMQVNIIEVPALYDWWVWNFVLHWSFTVEICIVIAAIVIMMKHR